MPECRGAVAIAARAVASTVLGAAFAAPSFADGFFDDGFYVELEPGLAMMADPDLHVRSDFFEGDEAIGDIETDPTWVIGGAVGVRWHGFRLEADASYREIDFDEVTLRNPVLAGGGGQIGDDGDVGITTGLLNVFYGLRLGRFEPFVGGGLGFADVDLDGDYGMNVLIVNENSTEFAWMISGGLGFAIHEHVEVSLGYRYVGMTDPDFATVPYQRVNPNPPPPMLDVNGTAEIEVVLHEIFAGLRYKF